MCTPLLLGRYATSLLTTLRTAQYHPLALIPTGLKWFTDRINVNARQAYWQDIQDFVAFAVLQQREQTHDITRTHVITSLLLHLLAQRLPSIYVVAAGHHCQASPKGLQTWLGGSKITVISRPQPKELSRCARWTCLTEQDQRLMSPSSLIMCGHRLITALGSCHMHGVLASIEIFARIVWLTSRRFS
jgi:hypothetical protein